MYLQHLAFAGALTAATTSATPSSLPAQAPLTPGAHHAIVNDLRLWYRVAGRADRVPIVFLHGGPGQGSQSFATLVGPSLERQLRMVYLDQRGSGRSERPWTKIYSLDVVVDDLERLRQAWGVPKIGIIGHSIGTLLAMEYGAKYPEHVAGMVLRRQGRTCLPPSTRNATGWQSSTPRRMRARWRTGSPTRC